MTKIAIIGDGIVGCVAARLLARQFPHWQVAVYGDGKETGRGKSIVINKGVADVLKSLSAFPKSSCPIRNIDVRFGSGSCATAPTATPEDFYYGICPAVTLQLLRESMQSDATNITHHIARIRDSQEDDAAACVRLATSDGTAADYGLLVLACALPQYPPPMRRREWAYHQTIFSFVVRAPNHPPQTACQYFYDGGVAVLVPRPDAQAGIVVCIPAARGDSFNAQSDAELSATLTHIFGQTIVAGGERYVYAPLLQHTTPMATARTVAIGGGATTLHPIGAQSYRLGVADAVQLVEELAAAPAAARGGDFAPALRRYHRRRRIAHATAISTTSALAAAVHCNPPPLQRLGALAAAALTNDPLKKYWFAHLQKLA